MYIKFSLLNTRHYFMTKSKYVLPNVKKVIDSLMAARFTTTSFCLKNDRLDVKRESHE